LGLWWTNFSDGPRTAALRTEWVGRHESLGLCIQFTVGVPGAVDSARCRRPRTPAREQKRNKPRSTGPHRTNQTHRFRAPDAAARAQQHGSELWSPVRDEEAAGSNPVPPTSITAGQRPPPQLARASLTGSPAAKYSSRAVHHVCGPFIKGPSGPSSANAHDPGDDLCHPCLTRVAPDGGDNPPRAWVERSVHRGRPSRRGTVTRRVTIVVTAGWPRQRATEKGGPPHERYRSQHVGRQRNGLRPASDAGGMGSGSRLRGSRWARRGRSVMLQSIEQVFWYQGRLG